ncbi:MAG: short-chain dehydrogenase [Pseudomonadales bacterium RIFCSPHIGHO2_12_FULL_40_16]|nr:MAG: short-chain dehydrogenase [Pseudomonadales bacterium RIFCSPHIGHO2_12_FULL_40_16]
MKTAWVTGGSSGIGLELTKYLLKDNFQVCIFAHAGIEQAVIDLQKRSPAVCGFEVDVQNESSIIAKFAEAVTAFGTPDLLINSAGISIAKSFEDMSSEEFLRQININLVGSRNVAHAALPYLKQTVQQGKTPKIVFIASAAGLVGCYGYTGYCASKFGVIGLAEVLRMELRSEKIDVAVVCPPEVDTPLVTEERKNGSPVTAALKQLGGSMPVEKACQEIYSGIFSSQFMIIPGAQLRILTKISRVIPDVYRGQIDKKLDKILSNLRAS